MVVEHLVLACLDTREGGSMLEGEGWWVGDLVFKIVLLFIYK